MVPVRESLTCPSLLPSYSGKSVQFKAKLRAELFTGEKKKVGFWFPVQLLPAAGARINAMDPPRVIKI